MVKIILKVIGYILLILIIMQLASDNMEKSRTILELEEEIDWTIAEKLEVLEDNVELEKRIEELEKRIEELE